MIQNALFSCSFLHRRKNSNLFPRVLLADARVPSNAVANKVLVVRGAKIWSLLVDTIEATDEGIVRERDVRGIDRERIILERM